MNHVIQIKARQLIDVYYDRLKDHIQRYGFCGEFIESNYTPDLKETRLLCQCRSIFFLLDYAEITGDETCIELAFELYIVIQANYFNDEKLTWSQYPGGNSNTLYEYAFVLLAFAKLYKVKPIDSLKNAINRVDEILQDQYLSFESNFANLQESDGRLCQNALMHLFEAYLEAYKTFQTNHYLNTVELLLDTLMNLFLSQKMNLISEYAPLDNVNDIFEPGHSFEWASLLFEAEKLGIKVPIHSKHKRIVESAENLGVIDNTLVVGQLKINTDKDQSRFRVWPLFERLRYYAMTDDQATVESIFNSFIDIFFDKNNFPIEYVNQNLKADFQHVKATTSYHLINCFKYLLT
ncbi:AGE family epimerase/isomerase [Thiotrichales bacterium 19X7-9]|nr:AGE family epimerase/isomerase [Thiotrichales bacterium 19X7-9]